MGIVNLLKTGFSVLMTEMTVLKISVQTAFVRIPKHMRQKAVIIKPVSVISVSAKKVVALMEFFMLIRQ